MDNEKTPRRGYPWWGWLIAALLFWPALLPMLVGYAIPSTRRYLGAPGVIIAGFAMVVGFSVIIVVATRQGTENYRRTTDPPAVATATPTPKPSKDEVCLRDAACIRDKGSWEIAAESYCSPHIEDHARYTHEWTDGWGESKFHTLVAQVDGKAVRYIGNKVNFQNGFGAWQRMTYSCLYDPINERVLEVTVVPFN